MAFSNWFSRSNRGAGTYTTSALTIPSGVDKVTIQLNLLANSDFSTPDKTLIFRVETSTSGAVWIEQRSINWIGGAPSVKSGKWSATINGITAFAGQLVRATVIQTGSFRWGLRGEIA